MTTLAEIASGNTNAADVLFLVALVLAGIAALASTQPPTTRWALTALSGAVAALALAWLLL